MDDRRRVRTHASTRLQIEKPVNAGTVLNSRYSVRAARFSVGKKTFRIERGRSREESRELQRESKTLGSRLTTVDRVRAQRMRPGRYQRGAVWRGTAKAAREADRDSRTVSQQRFSVSRFLPGILRRHENSLDRDRAR